MAMAGEWEVTEQRIIDDDDGEKKPDAVALGVRKRAAEDEDEEAAEANKRRWGSAYRSHPTDEDDTDLDALLGNVVVKGKGLVVKSEARDDVKVELKEEPNMSDVPSQAAALVNTADLNPAGIKREPSDGGLTEPTAPPPDTSVKPEAEHKEPEVVFKKRKAKNIRQK